MWQSVEILNDFSTLTVKQIFWNTKNFFKKLEYQFLVESTKMHHFHTKLSYRKPMLRQIEWWVQNEPITKNGVLPVITLLFWSFYFSFWTSCKELIWCTHDPNVHIPTFLSAGVLFNCALSLWVSLTHKENLFHLKLCLLRSSQIK